MGKWFYVWIVLLFLYMTTVCFGYKPCYMVSDAPDSFFHDFSEKCMASLSKAKKRN